MEKAKKNKKTKIWSNNVKKKGEQSISLPPHTTTTTISSGGAERVDWGAMSSSLPSRTVYSESITVKMVWNLIRRQVNCDSYSMFVVNICTTVRRWIPNAFLHMHRGTQGKKKKEKESETWAGVTFAENCHKHLFEQVLAVFVYLFFLKKMSNLNDLWNENIFSQILTGQKWFSLQNFVKEKRETRMEFHLKKHFCGSIQYTFMRKVPLVTKKQQEGHNGPLCTLISRSAHLPSAARGWRAPKSCTIHNLSRFASLSKAFVRIQLEAEDLVSSASRVKVSVVLNHLQWDRATVCSWSFKHLQYRDR